MRAIKLKIILNPQTIHKERRYEKHKSAYKESSRFRACRVACFLRDVRGP
jgi:hypothetical protein